MSSQHALHSNIRIHDPNVDRRSHDYGSHNALPASLRMPQRIGESSSGPTTRRCLVVAWSRALEGNVDSCADQVQWVGRQGLKLTKMLDTAGPLASEALAHGSEGGSRSDARNVARSGGSWTELLYVDVSLDILFEGRLAEVVVMVYLLADRPRPQRARATTSELVGNRSAFF